MTICLNMIVKDESHVIRRCLGSVKHLIDHWVIVDTGSTDGTQAVVQDFLHGIPGQLHERPWVNFGYNREEALVLARGKAGYILFIDADDLLIFSESFSLPPLEKDIYLCMQQVKSKKNPFACAHHPIVLMIKDLPDFHWKGALHEAIEWEEIKTQELLSGVINEYRRDGHRSQDQGRYHSDIRILEKAIQDDPFNSRDVFQLARTYAAGDDFPSAIRYYEKRAGMGGREDEVFYSLLNVGLLQKSLGMSPEIFLDSLSKAYQYRPVRAEPLFEITQYHIKTGEYASGFHIAQHSRTLPLLHDLYVEAWVYDWGCLYQYHICAKHLGKQDEASESLNTLLANPNLPRDIRESIACINNERKPMKIKKTICLNMIVKNESHVIRRCLESVKGLIDYWVIVDTGSTDGTQKIIREFLQDIPGELHERPWVNFGHNRNEALAFARGKADYFLFIDADDYLLFSETFSLPKLDKDFYMVQQRIALAPTNEYQGDTYQPIMCLIKDLPEFQWEGVLHESIPLDLRRPHAILQGVTNEYMHDGSRSKDPEACKKDIEILKEAIQNDPDNRAKYIYYLAKAYTNAGDYHTAIEYYEKRAAIDARDEKARLNEYQAFISLYFAGKLREQLNMGNEIVLKTYARAYCTSPTRAESLFHMSRVFFQTGQYFLGYLTANMGKSIPKPVDVHVEEPIYDWAMLYLFCLCALQCQRYQEAHHAMRNLLANPRLPRNEHAMLEQDMIKLKQLLKKDHVSA